MAAKYWHIVHHSDPRALDMADRHYSRQSPGTPEFTPSGHKIVLMHFAPDGTPAALWAWHRPAPGKAVRVDGLDAWACTLFRVEQRTVLASELIRETKVRGRDVWGYCYIKAGWQVREARTKDKDLVVLTLPCAALAAIEPVSAPVAQPPWGIAWRRWPRKHHSDQLALDLLPEATHGR